MVLGEFEQVLFEQFFLFGNKFIAAFTFLTALHCLMYLLQIGRTSHTCKRYNHLFFNQTKDLAY
jgi:hypothetical protein